MLCDNTQGAKMKTIMKRKEVCAVTGLCYTRIYNKMKRGEFPSSKQLGLRSVGWLRQDVQTWLDGLQPRYEQA